MTFKQTVRTFWNMCAYMHCGRKKMCQRIDECPVCTKIIKS